MLSMDEVKKKQKNDKQRRESTKKWALIFLKEFKSNAISLTSLAQMLGVDKNEIPLVYIPSIYELEFYKIDSYYDDNEEEWYLYATLSWEKIVIIVYTIVLIVIALFMLKA